MLEHFNSATHSQFFLVVGTLQTCCNHFGATDAKEFGIGTSQGDCLDQTGAQHIARGFTGNQPNTQWAISQRAIRVILSALRHR